MDKNTAQNKAHAEIIKFGRRVFLGMAGAGILALIAGRQIASLLDKHFIRGDNSVEEGFFRFYNISGVPQISPSDWRLTVNGLVENPLSWNLAQFQKLSNESQTTDFECVTGWIVKNVTWKGVRLKTIFDIAKPKPQAGFITFHSTEKPYVDSLSITQALEAGVMLAYEMKGQPLLQEQGWPLRLLVPPMYGYKSVKWVERMEFTEQQAIGYWEKAGYPIDAYLGTAAPVFPTL